MARARVTTSVAELRALLSSPSSVSVLDASWHMPAAHRNARAEWVSSRIPTSRFFDIDEVSDHATPLPHMLPPPHAWADAMAALGVCKARRVIVYDSLGLFSAARAWWMLRAFGHPSVSVLDGGLPAWLADGCAADAGAPPVAPPAAPLERWELDASLVRSMSDVRAIVRAGAPGAEGTLLVDARPAARFLGDAPEPRAGLSSGHIPRARSLPFGAVVEHGALLPPTRLVDVFAAAGVDTGRAGPIVASCGSGVTACVLHLALASLGRTNDAVYDGSWAEWGQTGLNDVAKGHSATPA